ncbi:4Fe-4S dicluster domain-containing protein [Fonticella tunisiensis]|uniref:RnfABCDGE-type electron transport complex C subunit n=1 Tax=Fonticella tunisiensis TaxID=1096341 RepID=A0A4R7K8P2_9CLOT|nr:4Fe-4S dicluster domain-containing protein [Fonticella tunisiensis]TDT50368.1 RnfABCDGE-type electron transport complex C subunit [Fonticella tunisiensis]
MDLLDKIYEAGVVGAGGAGFPAHIKLNCKVEYLIVNGLECEPLLKTDQYIMRTHASEIIEALEKITERVEAKHIVIGIKKKYNREIKALEEAISRFNSRVKLHRFDSIYPAGDEQVLVYEVTGRVIPPGGIPLNVGAVVSNVGTVYNIYRAINDTPVTEKYLSVIGDVREPRLLKVPIGTSLKECIEACGGALSRDYDVIMGGPMMGRKIADEDVENRVITKTDGAVIVIPKNHYVVERDRRPLTHIINQAKSACIQCRFCTDMCPRHLLGHPLSPHKIMRAIALSEDSDVFKEALTCSECGICELYACPMGLSPRKVNIYLKGKLREKGIRYQNTLREVKAHEMRDCRRVPTSRLVARLGLNSYKGQIIGELQELKVSKVRIPLRQHIGVPAKPVVNAGDSVEAGQVIGRVDMGQIGANIHASISGTVDAVTGDSIVIQNAE